MFVQAILFFSVFLILRKKAFHVCVYLFLIFILSSGIHVLQVNWCHGGLICRRFHHSDINPSTHQLFFLMLSLLQTSTFQQVSVSSFPSMCPCILIIWLPLISKNMWYLVLCSYVSLLKIMASSFIHIPAWTGSHLFCGCIVFHCIYVSYLLYPVYR